MLGTIQTVEVHPQGAMARAWSATLTPATETTPAYYPMEVDSAVDLDPEGGTLLTPDEVKVTYLGFTEGGVDGVDPEEIGALDGTTYDPDIVWMVDPGPAGGLQDDQFMALYPTTPETIAMVQLHEDDDCLVEAVVAHALRPQLAEGPRSADEAESVELELVNGELTVVDILGRPAGVRSDMVDGLDDALSNLDARLDASADALAEARELLATKTGTRYAATPPGTASGVLGDTWWQLNAGGAASTLWRYGDDGWQTQPLSGGVLAADQVLADRLSAVLADFQSVFADRVVADMLVADQALAQKLDAVIGTFQEVFAGTITADMLDLGTLRGKLLQGLDIYSPDQVTLPQVHLAGGVLEVRRATGEVAEDGTPESRATISVGGDTDDQVLLSDVQGNILAGFDAAGGATAKSLTVEGDSQIGGTLDVGDLILNGTPIDDLLSAAPRGLIARQKLGNTAAGNSIRFGSSWLGYYELYFDSAGGRSQKVVYDGMVYCSGAGQYNFQMLATSTPGYDTDPGVPLADGSRGNQVAIGRIMASTAGFYPLHMEAWFGNYGGTYRVLLACQTSTSGVYGYLASNDNWPSWYTAEDMGPYLSFSDGGYNQCGGTPAGGSGSAGTVTPTRPKKTYTTTWNARWVKSWRGSSDPGDYLHQGYYGGYQRYSMIGFSGINSVSGETGKTMGTAMSSAQISKIEIYLLNLSFYYGSGGKAIIGHHGNDNPPGSAQTSGGGGFASPTWTGGSGRWVTLPYSWYAPLANGTYDGITLGENAGSNMTYYGKFSRKLTDCKLRATYTK